MLQCTICSVIIKNEILWEKHAKSQEHIIGLKLLKDNLQKKKIDECKKKEERNDNIIKEDKALTTEIVENKTLNQMEKLNEESNANFQTQNSNNNNFEEVNNAESIKAPAEQQIMKKNKLMKLLSEDDKELANIPKV
jgi:hypothetical protein